MANIKVLGMISAEELYELYHIQGKSTQQIANILNCNKSTIGDLLKRYNIQLRPPGGARKKPIVKIIIDEEKVEAKECTQCGLIKPLDSYGFCRKSSGGRQPKCKECRKNYYNMNQEYIIKKSRKHYYAKHGENKLKRQEYYRINREEIRREQRKWYYLNKEEIAANSKIKYLKKREQILEKCRLYRLRNLEKIREYDRNRYPLRKKERESYNKEYYRRNKQKFTFNAKKRKKYVRALPFTLTPENWLMIERIFHNSCALSEHTSDLNIEHFIPVVWGHGGTYVGNVYPLYWAINRSKSDTNPFVWIEREDVKSLVNLNKWNELISYLANQNDLTVDELKDFVYWCEKNKRSVEDIKKDPRPSIEIWKSLIK
ncbi:hypothetical protein [Peribacillus loiseleuriae]|uniref:hypothetical protein n=1 Tax=Peribacillus loiseleuriae TaxID=1679170 RepID=UPI003D05C31F